MGFRPFIFSPPPAAPDSGSSLQTPESRHGQGTAVSRLRQKLHPDTAASLLSTPSSLIWTPVALYSIGVMSLAARMAGAGLDHWQPPLPTGPSQKTTCRFGTCHPTHHIAVLPEPHAIVARSPPHLQPPTTFHSRSDDGLGETGNGKWETRPTSLECPIEGSSRQLASAPPLTSANEGEFPAPRTRRATSCCTKLPPRTDREQATLSAQHRTP